MSSTAPEPPLFGVLGPLEVRTGAAELSGKPATLLALLLLNADAWVSTDLILDVLWGDTPPPSANRNVKTYIWQLRRSLPPAADGAARLEGRRGGYRIRVTPGEVDAGIVEALAAAPPDGVDPAAASLTSPLAAALALWRGDPYPELPPPVSRIAVARLEQVRWDLRDRLAAALLASGRYVETITLVTPLVTEDPLREGLWAHLIRALAGAGRRSEALSSYQRARRLLVDELGVEPGPQLQAVQQQVLAGDPQAAPAPAASPAARRSFLPRDIPDFVGRTDELAALLRAGRHGWTGSRVAIVDGLPGVGKTTLALRAGHRLADDYPDGQFFCALRGHDVVAAPAAPTEVLAGLLRTIGVPGGSVPARVEDRAALWRATLTGARVLIVLDDAASAAQIRPLLPGAGNGLVIVTTRRRLAEPDGARTVTLEPLASGDAVDLLSAATGDARVRADGEAALAVVTACGGLPMALRIAAARLRSRPAWTVRTLADRLSDEETRFGELRVGERDLAALFAASYRRLDTGAAQVFRTLGRLPRAGRCPLGPADVAAEIVAQTGLSPAQVDAGIDALLDAHLIGQLPLGGGYTVPDLVGVYARSVTAGGRAPRSGLTHRRRAVPSVARTA